MPQTVSEFLDTPFELSADQIAYFRGNGFIKLKQVLSKEVIEYIDLIITEEVNRLNKQQLALEDRDTYGKAFLQIMNIWRNSESVKEIVFGKRLAQIAANLLEVSGVRIYHDQALYKEPSGGHTPWHADQYYWPLDSDKTITAWMPLQETPLDWGPLEFSAGSDQLVAGRDKEISDDSLILCSEFPHGYSLNQGRSLYYYGKHIMYSIPTNYPVSILTFNLSTDKNDDGDYKFSVINNNLNTKDDYLKSAILDIFNFDLSWIESEIKKVDCYNEILNPLEDYSFLTERVKDFIII